MREGPKTRQSPGILISDPKVRMKRLSHLINVDSTGLESSQGQQLDEDQCAPHLGVRELEEATATSVGFVDRHSLHDKLVMLEMQHVTIATLGDILNDTHKEVTEY